MSESAASGAPHPAQNIDASSGAAAPVPHNPFVAPNPRAEGYRPTPDWRQQVPAQGDVGQQDGRQTPASADKINIDGSDFTHDQVRQAIARQLEADARKAALPQDPRGYETKLPADFKPPEGMKFEFDEGSPEMQRFRQLAHARGLDQDAFSDFLGVYAANKIGEQQQLATARGAELSKLGSAAQNRIGAVETWLKARVGNKADVIAAQLKAYPVASMIEAFEGLMRQFTDQGGAPYSQSGRHQEDNTGKIPGYDKMTFAQRRAAQDAQAGKPMIPGGRMTVGRS